MSVTLKIIAGLCACLAHLGASEVVRDLHRFRQLTQIDVAEPVPLHLRAVVNYYVPERYRLYIQSESGDDATFADQEEGFPQIQRGDLVEFTGHAIKGNLSPIVEFKSYRIIRHLILPAPKPITISQTARPASECHRAHFSGRVLSAYFSNRSHYDEFDSGGLDLVVGTPESHINVTIDRQADLNPVTLSGADVQFDGIVTHNSQRGQFLGSMLFVQEAADLRIIKAAQSDPFSFPLFKIHDVLRSRTENNDGRVHISGSVISHDLGGSFFVQDDTQGILVETAHPVDLKPGDLVDVVGYPVPGNFSPMLRYAVYQKKRGISEVQAAPLKSLELPSDLQQLGSSWLNHDGELVELEAELVGQRVSSNKMSMLLRSGKVTFSAELLDPHSYGADLANGSWLKIRGVCTTLIAGLHNRPEGMDLLLRSPSDIQVLRTPPWWTGRRLLWVLGAASACLILLAVWIFTLRARVRSQTAQLFERATRDGLTRLLNRAEILGLLERELALARKRGSALTVILIDLDHFKSINDTFGHQAGDAVLVDISSRLSQKIRPTDSIGRYGGEELLAILPGLANGPDRNRIEDLRMAVSGHPVLFEQESIPVTCSMGVAWSSDGSDALHSVIKSADAALYRAKRKGRNRVELEYQPAFSGVE